MYIYIHIYIFMYSCIISYINMYIYLYLYQHLYLHLYLHLHIYMYIYVYMYIYHGARRSRALTFDESETFWLQKIHIHKTEDLNSHVSSLYHIWSSGHAIEHQPTYIYI